MRLSIAIVSWNTRELLRQCLLSLYECTCGMDIEIVVVDNASADGSQEMVRREFPAVRLFVSKVNAGFAAGANLAIQNSTGRYVLLLNSDTIMMPGSLGTMKRFLEDHPHAGVVGCKLLNPDGTAQLSYRRFPTLTWDYLQTVLLSKTYHHVKPLRGFLEPMVHGDGPDGRRSVDWVSGACLMTRREVFNRIGLLDERFFMFCEEIDWCYRVKRAGLDIHYLPDARVIHYGGESSRQQRLRTYWALAKSTYHYFRKLRTESHIA